MSERWTSELTRQGAQFSDGRITAFTSESSAEFAALANGAVLCDLSHLGLTVASGEDAAAFLHGQFCNDVVALTDGKAQWNGWCSPKGRLLVTALVWPGKQGFYLLLTNRPSSAFKRAIASAMASLRPSPSPGRLGRVASPTKGLRRVETLS